MDDSLYYQVEHEHLEPKRENVLDTLSSITSKFTSKTTSSTPILTISYQKFRRDLSVMLSGPLILPIITTQCMLDTTRVVILSARKGGLEASLFMLDLSQSTGTSSELDEDLVCSTISTNAPIHGLFCCHDPDDPQQLLLVLGTCQRSTDSLFARADELSTLSLLLYNVPTSTLNNTSSTSRQAPSFKIDDKESSHIEGNETKRKPFEFIPQYSPKPSSTGPTHADRLLERILELSYTNNSAMVSALVPAYVAAITHLSRNK